MKIRKCLHIIVSLLLVVSLAIPAYAVGEVKDNEVIFGEAGNPILEISESEKIDNWLGSRPNAEKVYIPKVSKICAAEEHEAAKGTTVSKDLAYYIARETIREVGQQDGFVCWQKADLSDPITIQNTSGETACYLFSIIYNGKVVGEIAASAVKSEAPVIYFTFSNPISVKAKSKGAVRFVEGSGFVSSRNGKSYYFGTEIEADLNAVVQRAQEDISAVNSQWEKSVAALKNNTTMLYDVAVSSASIPSSLNITTVQDYTWYQNCGSTAATMVIDWYGRYKDPQLLLTSRPHSNSVNSRLLQAGYFGSDGPTYTEWINGMKTYLQNNSSCTVSVTGVDHGNNSTTWTNYKNHIGVTGEPDIVRIRYLSNGQYVGHAMAGVGYTGNYYRVRDTWTEDGIITDQFFYNSSSYSFSCILINVGTSSWRTTTLRSGSTGVNVRRLETMLYNLYYNPGTIDGTFDANTEAAVRAFQSDVGLTVDGIVGTNTYSALVSAHRFSMQSRILSIGCEGDDVAELQKRLNRFRKYGGAQYSSMPVIAEDGVFGSGTQSAVIAFQQASGLTADGIVGSNTYGALLN